MNHETKVVVIDSHGAMRGVTIEELMDAMAVSAQLRNRTPPKKRTDSNFQKVKAFMKAMDQVGPGTPSFPDSRIQELRVALIQEELNELKDAILNEDIVEVADAVADLLYVVYGTAEAFGFDGDAVFDEVHESNMTKLGPDGIAIKNAAGKVMKPATYRRPDLRKVLGVPDERKVQAAAS